jgi:hypothetical protein
MKAACALSALVFVALFCAAGALAQDGKESDPAAALTAALTAACRANETQFANYLTADNAAAFRALSADQRSAILQRLSLSDQQGKPLISTDARNHMVLRCVASGGAAEFRFGDVRVHENLAFVPVTAVNDQQTEFGMVRESGGWRLLSLGLVLLDIPQLSKQWSEGDISAREDAAIANLRGIADAIQTYRRAWNKMPDSLAQLGPAPTNQVSPDQASLVNEHLAAGSAAGYRFRYRVVSPGHDADDSFELSAVPEDYGKTGRRSFILDSAGKIHAADKRGQVASLEDPEIP